MAAAVQDLQQAGVEAWGEAVDIADGPALKGFVTQAGERLGGIDVLVSNASALVNGATEADWRAMFEIDMLGAVRTFEAAFPFLEKAAADKGDAAFVIVSSVSAAETSGGSAYGPMKAALIHYAKGLARQHAAKKVRANVVSPGTVLFDGGVWGDVRDRNPGFFAQMIKRNPTGRMATPEEIAAAVVFLASPRSAFTTGSNLLVDGAISSRVNF
ncbi:SDR family NAD(P)-dependent oxidoreductase [Phenylobacterium sp. J367]|uniref:SDR family NAD(P)-dependent oxidoreductase n=1 Tax=Phenylobacterium sp. J367 TaxID=2898435 RepID=UPI002150D3A9|nr:SDR family oxidoreductase [Phenylobacterium sp. J367]MCR5880863.1 SDR family oxidoreductase [Phenylobacterium sp. J367]